MQIYNSNLATLSNPRPRVIVRFSGNTSSSPQNERCVPRPGRKAKLTLIAGGIFAVLGTIAAGITGGLHKRCNTPTEGAVAKITKTTAGVFDHFCPNAYLDRDGKVTSPLGRYKVGKIDENGTIYNLFNMPRGQAKDGKLYLSILSLSDKLKWPLPSAQIDNSGTVSNIFDFPFAKIEPINKEKMQEMPKDQKEALAIWGKDDWNVVDNRGKDKKKGKAK